MIIGVPKPKYTKRCIEASPLGEGQVIALVPLIGATRFKGQ